MLAINDGIAARQIVSANRIIKQKEEDDLIRILYMNTNENEVIF